jgi:hypothetical protein
MSVALGLPAGFKPSPEIAMSAGVQSQLVRVQPNNISSITSGTQTVSYTATNGYVNNLTFPSQLIQFSIPAGAGAHTWIDTEKTTLSFRVTYSVKTAGAGNDSTCTAYLQGGASSFINRIVTIGPDGATLDDVVNQNLATHCRQLMEHNISDRDVFAASQGFLADIGAAQNLVQGHVIQAFSGAQQNSAGSIITATNDQAYSYEIPFENSLLGCWSKGFMPIGLVNKLDVQLYTVSQLPITFYAGATTITTSPQVAVVIDNIALNLFYLTLDSESVRMLGSLKTHYVHGVTARVASSIIPASTSGYTNTLIGLRGKSCRTLWTRFSDLGTVAGVTNANATAAAVNGVYDSKLPLCSQMNYLLQGKDRVPMFPHNTQILPASVFSRMMFSSEKFKQWEQRSSFVPVQYFKYIDYASTAPSQTGGYDFNVINAGYTSSSNNLCTFIFGEDLRKAHSSQVLDGYDLTVTANHFLELNFLSAPLNSQTAWFIGRFDIIYEISEGVVHMRM